MSNNPLSNLSYTNKDFNSIYVELLDLVKQLTYKWDPSISNESDPGNILLKLDAIIGDKNNYNIDKNILENFPETLTQDISARSLYKQLAYKMPWYKAATTDVTFKWVGKDANELTDLTTVSIPKFQMVCDENNEFIYTTLTDMYFNKTRQTNSVKAIEGIITTLNLNGQEVIELSNLDYHNRLYFHDNNVAENGIFIYNEGGSDNDYWTMVENLQVEPLGKKYFEFGIDSRKNVCYVEFPEDIHNLIGSGLIVKYIVTNGANGNIISRTLDRFYQENSVEVNGQSITLNSDVIQLTNPSGTSNGTDPETIEDAYKNYRKTAGTFHTLVTLRDYINAICKSGLVSNALVCDRLNDIQSTYTIVTDDEFTNSIVKQVASNKQSDYVGYIKLGVAYSDDNVKPQYPNSGLFSFVDGSMYKVNEDEYDLMPDTDNLWKNYFMISEDIKEDLGAFDLKLYLLHTPGSIINSLDDYKKTFELEKSGSPVEDNVKSYIEEERCVQHDFKEIIPNIPCLFKNSFPLDIKIIPHYKLNNEQVTELKININKALFKLLNSSNIVEFGLEADYDVIYDTIFNADKRIKVLILDDFTYNTFATYWDGKEFKDIPISEFNSEYLIDITSTSHILAYREKLGEYLYNNSYFIKRINTSDDIDKYDVLYFLLYKNIVSAGLIKELNIDISKISIDELKNIILNNNVITGEQLESLLENYVNKYYIYKVINDEITLYSDKIDDFRRDVITKSILAGRTPLYNQDTKFQYTLEQDKIELIDTKRVDTHLKICPHGFEVDDNNNYTTQNPIPIKITEDNKLDKKVVEYKLKANENIRFLAPSFITTTTYSNYVKFELILNGNNKKVEWATLEYNEKDDSTYTRTPIKTLTNSSDEDDVYEEQLLTINYQEYIDYNKVTLEGNDRIYAYDSRPIKVIYPDNSIVEYDSLIQLEKVDKNAYDQLLIDWENEDCIVKSYIYLCDLTKNQLDEWKAGNLEVIYEAVIYSIPANTDYELQEGEYITFFYKTEDNNESPYTYVKYEKGTIIKPSFVVPGTLKDDCIFDPSEMASTGIIPYSELSMSTYQKIYSLYNYNDLSGSKTIAIREMNEVTLKYDEYSYYFITNKIDNITNQYILQPKELDGVYTYTLDSDEYFIYTNSDKTEFATLYAGTKIIFGEDFINKFANKDDISLKVEVVDYSKIESQGLISFTDKLINGDFEVVLREQQIYNFSEDDKIILTLNDDIIDNIIDEDILAPYFETNETTIVKDFEVTYESQGTIQSLPKIQVTNSDAQWNATAVLNINCSYDQPQKIQQNDNYSYKYIGIDNELYSPNDNDMYMLSSVMLDKVGGHNIDVTYLDSYGERTNPYIFLYENVDIYDKSPFTKTVDGNLIINVSSIELKDENGKPIINLTQKHKESAYNLLLPIRNVMDENPFELYVNGEALKPINSDYTKLGRGIYYFELDSSIEDLFIKLDKHSNSFTDQLIIEPLFKFTYNDLFKDRYGINYDSIYQRIRYYDINNLFNYTHQVESDLYIEDPLESKAFFNSAHIFNQFTLPMAELYMSDKTKSNIKLINNR